MMKKILDFFYKRGILKRPRDHRFMLFYAMMELYYGEYVGTSGLTQMEFAKTFKSIPLVQAAGDRFLLCSDEGCLLFWRTSTDSIEIGYFRPTEAWGRDELRFKTMRLACFTHGVGFVRWDDEEIKTVMKGKVTKLELV